MPIILGANSWLMTPLLTKDNAREIIGKLAELPIPGERKLLEYLVFDPPQQKRYAVTIRNEAKRAGFQEVSVCGFIGNNPEAETYSYSLSPVREEQDAALDTGYQMIEIARRSAPKGGTPRLGGPFYRMHKEMLPVGEAQYQMLVDFLTALTQRAYEEGVELDGEFLNRFEWSGPNNIKQMAGLINDVKQNANKMDPFPLKAQVDMFHVHLEGEDFGDAVVYAAENGCLGSIHAGDTTRMALGTGALADKYAQFLHDIYTATDVVGNEEEVPMVPEFFCEGFRPNVAIWTWPRDVPMQNPYSGAIESYKMLGQHIGQYAKQGVHLLSS